MEHIFADEFVIIEAAIAEVRKTLGIGFTHKIYEEAIAVEIEFAGLKIESEKKINIHYKEQLIGTYLADMLVNDEIIIEIKQEKKLNETHTEQLMNCLVATSKKLGILVNFPNENKEYEIIRVTNIKKY